eukprot:2293990-Pyramimonas_sp.AAC.1
MERFAERCIACDGGVPIRLHKIAPLPNMAFSNERPQSTEKRHQADHAVAAQLLRQKLADDELRL